VTRVVLLLLLLCLPLCSVSAEQQEWVVGQTLETMAFTDQHGRNQVIDETTSMVLFAADREAAKLVHAAIENQAKDYLPAQRVVYVADISRMPWLIARILAIPRMQDYDYPIALGRKSEDCVAFPRQKGKISLIYLDHQKLKKIVYATTADMILPLIESSQ
jgi:hypothetical protein